MAIVAAFRYDASGVRFGLLGLPSPAAELIVAFVGGSTHPMLLFHCGSVILVYALLSRIFWIGFYVLNMLSCAFHVFVYLVTRCGACVRFLASISGSSALCINNPGCCAEWRGQDVYLRLFVCLRFVLYFQQ